MGASARQEPASEPALVVGRYELVAQLARGGLATVYLARLLGDGGLRRTVAVKRLHAQFRTDDDVSTMFLDEARLALRVRHPNVIHAIDVVLHEGELFLVMEYIAGASLSQLMRVLGKGHVRIELPVASAIMSQVLHGLHAAHTACDERGAPLAIVHRDVSPQNVLVGLDGHARVLDFGVAKAVNQAHVTRLNEVKGKLAYMPPEALLSKPVDARSDLFSAGVVLWELLTGYRLFYGDNDGAIVRKVLEEPIPPPSSLNAEVMPALDAIVLRALERDAARRFATADEMALALEAVVRPASAREVTAWVREVVPEALAARDKLLARVEQDLAPSEPYQPISVRKLITARSTTADEGSAVSLEPLVQEPAPPARWFSVVVGVGALAVVALVGTVFVLAHRSDRGLASAVTAPPMTASAPPSSDIAPATSASSAVDAPPGASVVLAAVSPSAAAPTPSVAKQSSAPPHPLTRPANKPVPRASSSSNGYSRW